MPSERIFFSRLRVLPTHSANLLDSSTTTLVLAEKEKAQQRNTLRIIHVYKFKMFALDILFIRLGNYDIRLHMLVMVEDRSSLKYLLPILFP